MRRDDVMHEKEAKEERFFKGNKENKRKRKRKEVQNVTISTVVV
jgi:hypothetical protein